MVWTAHRYTLGEPLDGGRTWVTTLKVKEQSGTMSKVISSEGKSRLFEKAFFLGMTTMAPAFEDTTYHNPKFEFSPVTEDQIR